MEFFSAVIIFIYLISACRFSFQVNVTWGLPYFACDFYIAMDVICSTSSIFNLVAISVDRYVRKYTWHVCIWTRKMNGWMEVHVHLCSYTFLFVKPISRQTIIYLFDLSVRRPTYILFYVQLSALSTLRLKKIA